MNHESGLMIMDLGLGSRGITELGAGVKDLYDHRTNHKAVPYEVNNILCF